jgi:hypothetical protein
MMSALRVLTAVVFAAAVTAAGTQRLSSLIGNVQYQITAVGDRSTWVITPANPAATSVLIVFTALNMRQGEIRVYDTSAVSDGSVLFNCASCGSSLPPPFRSDTGSITIVANAISGVGFQTSTFALQYFGEPAAETNLLKNTYVNLNMGMAPIFPFTFKGNLPGGAIQQWAINTGAQIVFSFSSFNFPPACTTTLEIYNRTAGISSSSLLFRGCKPADAPSAWLYSSTGQALVVLTSTVRNAVSFNLNYASDADMFRCGSIDQPFVMSDQSMLIADGTKSTALMQRGVTCTWMIQPAVGAPVSLILNRVSLKFGSSVTIFDGRTDRDPVLWGAVGATLTVPPVITSTGQALYVRYVSDSSNAIRYFGFQGDYAAVVQGSRGSGKGYTQLGMSSALDIVPPGDGTTHTPGVRYIWYVAPLDCTGPITFALSTLRLAQPGTRLLLLEGVTGNTGGEQGGVAQSYNVAGRQILAIYTGTETPTDWVRTAGFSATIVFESNTTSDTSVGDFFQLAYFSDGPNYHCGFTTNPAVLRMQSFIITDGSSSSERAYPDQLCRWQLQPTNATAVVLVFDRFHLFDGYLRIYTGSGFTASNLFAEIGETAAAPAPITVTGGVVSLEYATTSGVTGFGFSLTYYGVTSSRSFPGDHLVTLTSASTVSLSLPTSILAPNTSLTWLLAPSSSTGRIYLAPSKLNLSEDCNLNHLDVHDGPSIDAPLLQRLCGSSLVDPYSWIQTSDIAATLHFVTHPTLPSAGNFDLSYFTDGPNFHCGFAVSPARLTAPSMVFTDGSGSETAVFSNQHCEWVIDPDGATLETRIVVEIAECDLAGASFAIYDGTSDKAKLLWLCDGCSSAPGPITSSASNLFVRFGSASSGPYGTGFRFVYWTAASETLQRSTSATQSSMLLLPTNYNLTVSPSNASAAFFLATSPVSNTLSFQPFYTVASSEEVASQVTDGRSSPSVFDMPEHHLATCGAARSVGINRLLGETVSYASLQRQQQYLHLHEGAKELLSLQGHDLTRTSSYAAQAADSVFSAPQVCKYRLDSGSPQAIQINVQDFTPRDNGRLVVYGGLNSEDAILFDSSFPELYLRHKSQFTATVVHGVVKQSVNLVAPCGQATIVLHTNHSALARVDYSLTMEYFAIPTDSGQKCKAYCKWLHNSVVLFATTVVVTRVF